jgi:hypothetical protein
LIGVVALVALGFGLFVLTSSEEAGAEVILEPTAASGTDPFTDSVAKENVRVKSGGVKQVAGGGRAIESLAGSAPGLYGGTGKQACDPKALVAYLKRNPDKAAAFASVLGITPNAIEDYVAKLTPVLLREDTRVTNHGFRDGHATTLQSVLQAGSAVMVDERGVPRVRCACGNPLTEPAAVSATPEFRGERWDGFDDGRLVAVSAADRPVKSFKLVNVRTGKEYVATAGSGSLTIQQLLNLTIPVEFCALPTVPWKNGVNPGPGTPQGPGEPRAEVVGVEGGFSGGKLQAVIGDVTGDGIAEGVLTTIEVCGASGHFGATYVFNAEGKLLATLPAAVNEGGAYEESHKDLRIANGGIELTVTGYASGDAHCCPSITRRARYEWNGSEFVLQ